MKKFLWMLALIGVFSWIAGANCLTVEFDNRDSFCLSLDKSGRTYSASIEDRDLSSWPNTLRCELLLPDNSLEDLGACNGSFTYSSSKEEKVKLYIRYNSTYYTVITSYLDFSDGTWGDSDSDINGGSRSKNSGLSISVDDTTLGKNDYTNMIIETDDYDGKIDFTVEYKDGSYETIAKRDYSDYFYDYKNDLVNGISISNDDYENIKNFIKFKKEGTYRITAEDEDENTSRVTITVGSSSSDSKDNDKLELEASDDTPDKNEYIDMTIRTDSDYEGKVKFTKVEYKDSGSFKNVSEDSDYYDSKTIDDKGSVSMDDEDGKLKISDFIKFKKKGTYRITAEDEDDNTTKITIEVENSSSDDLVIEADTLTPNRRKFINLTIKWDKNVKVYFDGYYKAKKSDSWTDFSATSSTYIYDDSSAWRNEKYTTSSTKDKITDFVAFEKEGYYKITAEDENGNKADDLIFSVWDVDEYDDDDDETLTVSVSTKTPSVGKYVDMTIKESDKDYNGKVNISVRYKEKKSDDYKTVRTTSSTYFGGSSSDYNKWKQGYVNIISNGKYEAEDFVKFKEEGYYEVTFTDKNYRNTSVVFNVWGSSDDDDDDSDIDGFTVKEEAKLKAIIDLWDRLISELKSESYKLRNDSTWLGEADRIYKKMKKTRDGKSDGYDSFFDLKTDLVKWISYAQLHQ